MNPKKLLTLINRYCRINDIYNQSTLDDVQWYIQEYNINDLEFVININDNRGRLVSIGVFTTKAVYKRVLIIKLIRAELLSELLK